MSKLVLVEKIQPGLVSLTLNRPERRNALCIAMLEELCGTVELLANDSSSRVIILQGAGAVFSSGLDLSEAANPELVQHSAHCVAKTLQLMRETPLVTIAATHGAAYAGGAGLMAACDIAIAAQDTQFAFPEAQRGLLPALICAVLSPKVREGDLRELFLVGNTISATRAWQIGLIQRVVDAAELQTVAVEIAQGVLRGGPQTIVATKRLLNQAYVPTEETSSQRMIDVHLGARHSPEAAEGLAAFLEKRSPAWHKES